ncbi:GntR family transcriptional regulator [uncultured Thermanaerothrix sp.]|uniref:GntR family transcriptional regulator n=1 Tax=uncultured Thermanaerothrix sp. TaxID=1195149 RepID=UPI0026290C09|nr:GntR family transcriptional regulator [uncultured Thermanaerothrix sp.]
MSSQPSHTLNPDIHPADPHNPLPLYYQVYTDLKRLIRTGVLRPGELLPSELTLCDLYKVGRQTVRSAILRLVDEGWLERHRGVGTYVLAPRHAQRFFLDRSFSQQMEEMGRRPHSIVLKQSLGILDEKAPEPLQPKRGSPCLYLTRLRFGDEEPLGIQHATIVTEHCPGLEAYEFNTQSLYAVLSQHYHLIIARITHTFSAVSASPSQAELLQIVSGVPLLLVKTTAFLENGEPIEYTLSYYRSDRFEFTVVHTL